MLTGFTLSLMVCLCRHPSQRLLWRTVHVSLPVCLCRHEIFGEDKCLDFVFDWRERVAECLDVGEIVYCFRWSSDLGAVCSRLRQSWQITGCNDNGQFVQSGKLPWATQSQDVVLVRVRRQSRTRARLQTLIILLRTVPRRVPRLFLHTKLSAWPPFSALFNGGFLDDVGLSGSAFRWWEADWFSFQMMGSWLVQRQQTSAADVANCTVLSSC